MNNLWMFHADKAEKLPVKTVWRARRQYTSFGMMEYGNKKLISLEKWDKEESDYPTILKG